MRKRNLLFQRAFGSSRSDEEPLLNDNEFAMASFVFDVACEELHTGQENPNYESDEIETDDDTSDTFSVMSFYSVLSFDEKIEAAMENFDHVVQVFKKTNKAKDEFLKSYKNWSGLSKASIETLREFADEMQTNKFNSDIARVFGGVVGAIGGILVGISFLTPLAAVTVPLAIGGGVAASLGGGVVAGTTGTEIVLLKNKLDAAKTQIKQEQERFSAMTHWFTHPEELEKAINSLLDYDVFKEMAEKVQEFLDTATELRSLTVGAFKEEFRKLLKLCIGKMSENSQIIDKFGDEVAPVVMTFVFVVCLMRDHNRILLDCVMITQRLALGLMSVVDIGVLAGGLIGGIAARSAANALARLVVTEIFVGLGVVIDVLNVVVSSIDLHKRPEIPQAKKVRDVADKFEKVFMFIENVYNETKKYESIAKIDVTRWTTVIINSIPDKAAKKDVKMAVQPHLPDEACDCIKLKKLPTKGNNWCVKIPTSHSQLLLQQSHLFIKGKRCEMIQ